MDGANSGGILPDDLYARLGTAAAPVLLDVRHHANLGADDRLIVSAIPCVIDDGWLGGLPAGKPIVVYCSDGRDVGPGAAATLCAAGIDGSYLAGGIAAWQARGLPTRRRLGTSTRRWVTRERPKIDRIACPWLIHRFIDPRAEFVFVSTADVRMVADKIGAIPFDIEGVEFAHEGERCSFDTLLRIFAIDDAPLNRLATIVRGADTSRHDLAPQCGGLFAISLGLSANFQKDTDMLAHGMVMYDALYVWCRSLQSETHNWPAKTPTPSAS
jgi:rhodanese-related sulfurtransferase